MIAQWIMVRNMIRGMHHLLSRIPFIKSVYQVSRDVFSALFSEGKKTFKCPVMIPFPSYPNRAIGFHVGDVPVECQSKVNEPLSAVFMPTSPIRFPAYYFLSTKKT